MEKGNKIYLIIIVICAILVIALCGFAIFKHSKEDISDGAKFKNEYEVLNDMEASGEYKYPIVSIDSNNPVVYKTPKEILDVLKNDEAIVYFGFASCPWCRNVVEPLLDSLKDSGVDTLYYVDIKDIRDTYEFSGSIKPNQTKKGVDAYYDILEFFGEKLDKYYVRDEAGNMYDTGVTRLYAPTVVAVKDGKILDMHVATIESQENPYVKLDENQEKELYDIFMKLIDSIKKDVCTDDAC